jgi:hypothetical protein
MVDTVASGWGFVALAIGALTLGFFVTAGVILAKRLFRSA